MAGNIKGITVEIGGKTTGLKEAIRGANKESRSLQNELKSVNKLLKGDPKNIVLLRQKQALLGEEVKKTRDKLEMLRSKQDEVQKAFENGEIGADRYRDFQRELITTENKLKALEREQKKFNSVALQLSAAKIKSFGEGMQKAGKTIMPLSLAVGAATLAAAKMGAEFDKAMAKVNTIADTTQVPLGTLRKEILKLSNDTGISATEIADNVYNAISAGQKTGDAVNFVRNSTMLAKAGFAEAGDSLDLLTSILNAYGLKASEVTRVSDILITTQNLGKTTVGELAKTMGKVIPTAKASGVAIEQLAAGYAIMTAEGVRTKETTTYMNSMLNELSKSGTKVSDVIKSKTGKSFQDLMKEGKTLGDVLQIVKKAADEQGLSFMDMFGSSEAAKAGLILLGDSSSKFNSMLGKMKASTGATTEAMKKLQTPAVLLKKALNQLKNIGIELGSSLLQALLPAIKTIAGGMKDLAKGISQMSPAGKKMIGVIALIIAAAGPLLMGVGKVLVLISQLMTALPMLATAFAALSGPLGIAALAVGALTAAFIAIAGDSMRGASKTEQAVNKLVAAHESAVKSYEDRKKAAEEAAASELLQLNQISALKNELSTLVDSNGRVKAGYEDRAKFIVGELSKATGIQIDLVNGEIQGYKGLEAEIDKYIEKKKAEAVIKANQESYQAALKLHNDEMKIYIESQAEIDRLTQKLEDSHSRGRGEWRKTQQAIEKATQTRDEAAKKVSSSNTEMMGYESNFAAFEQGHYDQISAFAITHGSVMAAVESGKRSDLEKTRTKLEQELKAMQALYKQTGDESIKIQIDQAQKELDLVNNKMTSLDNATKAGGAKVTGSTRGYSKTALDALAENNEFYRSLGKKKAGNHASGISSGKGNARTAGNSLASAAVQGTNSRTGEHRSVGRSIASGMAAGISNGIGLVLGAAGALAAAAINKARQKLHINSPSRIFRDVVGAAIPEGMAAGIIQNTKMVTSSVTKMAKDAVDTAKKKTSNLGSAFSFDVSGARQKLDSAVMGLGGTVVPDINMAIGRAPIRVDQRAKLEMEAAQGKVLERLDQMADALAKHLPKIGTGELVLDTGKVAGEMAPALDVELGSRQLLKTRGI